MKKILLMVILLSGMPFLAQAEETGVKVDTNGGSFEFKTGTPEKPPVKTVVVERTVVQQPKAGCSCRLNSGGPCK